MQALNFKKMVLNRILGSLIAQACRTLKSLTSFDFFTGCRSLGRLPGTQLPRLPSLQGYVSRPLQPPEGGPSRFLGCQKFAKLCKLPYESLSAIALHTIFNFIPCIAALHHCFALPDSCFHAFQHLFPTRTPTRTELTTPCLKGLWPFQGGHGHGPFKAALPWLLAKNRLRDKPLGP